MGVECADFPAPIAICAASGVAQGSEISVSVGPERIVLDRVQPDAPASGNGAASLNQAGGEVADIAYLGSHSIYHVRLASGRTVTASVPSVRWGDDPAPTWGDTVWVSWTAPAGVVLHQ